MSFTERDIRPAELDAAKRREIERDVAWLSERRNQFVPVACPACDADRSETAFQKNDFQFLRCSACGTTYMSPRAAPRLMAEFYARSTNYEFWDKYVFPASRDVRMSKIFRPRAERVLQLCADHRISTGSLMDVGASIGMFCEEVQKAGKFRRVIAVEPNRAQASTCRARGLETIEGDVVGITDLDGQLNVISSFEVIEHLFSPREFLRTCRRLLAPDGLIVVTCPNANGFDVKMLGVDSLSFDVEHVNMFNPGSLRRLFTEGGFKVLECTTPGELDAEIVRNAALEKQISLSDHPFVREILIEQWDRLGGAFQAFLRQNELSSHMWLAALKVDG